jgi:DDE domain
MAGVRLARKAAPTRRLQATKAGVLEGMKSIRITTRRSVRRLTSVKPASAKTLRTVALVDRGWQETGSVTARRTASVFAGFRFPPEVISVAVRWYLRYGLSYRDVEELLAERGVTVDHVSVYRWVQRFTPAFIEAARPCRHAPGGRWFVDETYLKVGGRWSYLYRAVDQHGQVIDVLLSSRRDLAAARRFLVKRCEPEPSRSRPRPTALLFTRRSSTS